MSDDDHLPPIDAADAGTWTLGDLEVNRMGFGSMRLTAGTDREAAVGLVRRAVELGVNHIDTAAFYVSPGGPIDGEDGPRRCAADIVREALAPLDTSVVISTTVGRDLDPETGTLVAATGSGDLRRQVEEDLRLLDRDSLDVVCLRIPDPESRDRLDEPFGVLAELQQEGLIRHLGLSNARRRHLDEAEAIAPVVCVQNAYALDIRRRFDELLLECARRGIAFVPYFSLAGENPLEDVAQDHSPTVKMLAQLRRATPQQVRLAWTLHQGHHVLAIPGTSDPLHLEQNIAAASIRLTNHELATLDAED